MSKPRKKQRGHLTKEAGLKMDNWLREHFFEYTSNVVIADIFGVCEKTITKHARALGLGRTKEDRYKRVGEATRRWRNEWKTSDDPAVRKRYNLFIARLTTSLRETRRLERIREKYGLPRRTKWRLTHYNGNVKQTKKRLRERGYILDETRMVAYYTDETRRSSLSERRVHYLKFLPYGAAEDTSKKVYVRPAYDGNINFN